MNSFNKQSKHVNPVKNRHTLVENQSHKLLKPRKSDFLQERYMHRLTKDERKPEVVERE